MYSLAAFTIRSYSAGVVLEDGHTVSGPALTLGGECASGASSASTIADSRSLARVKAVSALTPLSGRTGVTTVMESFTASNTTTMVGRTSTASGMPIGSGLGCGNSSISRTMS